jgi:hypothetical protein
MNTTKMTRREAYRILCSLVREHKLLSESLEKRAPDADLVLEEMRMNEQVTANVMRNLIGAA